jgi:hypothetical protein
MANHSCAGTFQKAKQEGAKQSLKYKYEGIRRASIKRSISIRSPKQVRPDRAKARQLGQGERLPQDAVFKQPVSIGYIITVNCFGQTTQSTLTGPPTESRVLQKFEFEQLA